MVAGEQYIYVLTNSSMPGIVKIGFTTRLPEAHAKEISRATGVPTEFEVYYSAQITDAAAVEKKIHQALEAKRVSYRREFFRMTPSDATKKVNQCCREHITKRLSPIKGKTKEKPKSSRASRRPAKRGARNRASSLWLVVLSLGVAIAYHFRIDLRVAGDTLSNFLRIAQELAEQYGILR